MSAVPFDTLALALARKLEAAGFPPKQAQDTAAALADVTGADPVTKDHLDVRRRNPAGGDDRRGHGRPARCEFSELNHPFSHHFRHMRR